MLIDAIALPSQFLVAADILGPERVRLIGGAVRDLLLAGMQGQQPTPALGGDIDPDLDLATTLSPESVMQMMSSHDIKVFPIGIKYGTVGALIQGKTVEITTLRQDIHCYGRQAVVAPTDDWAVDALRRDFTCNALSMDAEGRIYDYCQGLGDIQARQVRFIGEPELRIAEDFLRLLRYFRFHTVLRGRIHQASFDAVVQHFPALSHISRERIQREMLKLLSMRNAAETLAVMQSYRLLEVIGLDLGDIDTFKITQLSFSSDPMVNLVALLHTAGKATTACDALAERWALSRDQKRVLNDLAMRCVPCLELWQQGAHKQCVAQLGWDLYAKLELLSAVLGYNVLSNIQASDVPPFPLSASDLIQHGVPEGPRIGMLLSRARQLWLQSDLSLTRDELLNILLSNDESDDGAKREG